MKPKALSLPLYCKGSRKIHFHVTARSGSDAVNLKEAAEVEAAGAIYVSGSLY